MRRVSGKVGRGGFEKQDPFEKGCVRVQPSSERPTGSDSAAPVEHVYHARAHAAQSSEGCVCVYGRACAARDCSLQLFSKTQWRRSSNYFWSWMANKLLIACHFPRWTFYLPRHNARKALIIRPRWKCQGHFGVKSLTPTSETDKKNPKKTHNQSTSKMNPVFTRRRGETVAQNMLFSGDCAFYSTRAACRKVKNIIQTKKEPHEHAQSIPVNG